ncbi:MAG: PepSY domain-containing protein, partial [Solirubrobacteraceae bacterium]|nr:PepSY domain-containing protein [Solirubrobacteraceae bacterium]
GMYLWWPRGRRGFRDALRPRLRSKASRTRWRDLHAITGVLFGFVTLFFLLTGLAWTGVWGTKFGEIAAKTGQHYPAGLYDGAESVADTVKNGKAAWSAGEIPLAGSQFPQSGSGTASGQVSAGGGSGAGHTHEGDTANHNNHAAAGANGSAPGSGTGDANGGSSTAQPQSVPPGAGSAEAEPVGTLSAADVRAITAGRSDIEVKAGGDGHTGHAHADSLVWDPAKGAPLDAVVGRAQKMGFPAGFTIVYPTDEYGSYTLSKFPDADVDPNATAGSERIAYVDQYTALPIKDYGFDGFGTIGKATDFGIALHEGRQWGIWSQLFSLFGTLALLLSCATAVVMWRKRKPKGLGSPRRPPNRKLGAGVVVITLGLGLLFPLLGLSIVALLVFDFVIVRHVPPLRRALGAGR